MEGGDKVVVPIKRINTFFETDKKTSFLGTNEGV